MADIRLPFLYGKIIPERYVCGFAIQVHLTAKCDQKCKHCYMFHSDTYSNQINNPLTKEQWISLIDEYYSILLRYGCKGGTIGVTGGDPLLSDDFWYLLEYINQKYPNFFRIIVMGNPYHVTKEVADKMANLKVRNYQISIDGMQETHDYFRKTGSFNASIRALEILHDAGILTAVSMTVSKINAKDIFPLYEYLEKCDFVDEFGFDRLVPTGNGAALKDSIFSGEEYRQFLFEVYKHEVLYGERLAINKVEKMWKVLMDDLGLLNPYDKNSSHEKCGAGKSCIAVLSDGTVMACRRLNMISGKYPEQTLFELYANNDVTKMINKLNANERCKYCRANTFCNGCPAMKYAMTGNLDGREAYCWKM